MSTTTTVQTKKGEAMQQAPQNTAMVKPDTKALYEAVDKIDMSAARYREDINDPMMRDFRKAIVTAQAITEIKQFMMAPQVMGLLRSLMNTPLGFMTDHGPHAFRDDYKQEYSDEIVRTAALEAIINGILWTGNQFNIIAGRCYVTKEGYYYKLANLAGLTDLNVVPSVPVIREGMNVVRVAGLWKMNGVPASITDHEGKPGRNFPINVNKSMGPDAIIGKAYRKAYKAIWDKIHGCESSSPDDEDLPMMVAARSGSDELKGKLTAGAPVTAPNASTPSASMKTENSILHQDDDGIGEPPLADPREWASGDAAR